MAKLHWLVGVASVLPIFSTPSWALIIGKAVPVQRTEAVCKIIMSRANPASPKGSCSGTLIDATHVLTAGHCGPRGGPVTIECNGGAESRPAIGWMMGPRYDAKADADDVASSLELGIGDASIYEIEKPFSNKVHPIPYAQTSREIEALAADPSRCVIAGYSPTTHLVYPKPKAPKPTTPAALANGAPFNAPLAEPGAPAKKPPENDFRAAAWEPFDGASDLDVTDPKQKKLKEVLSYFAVSGPSNFVTPGDSGGPLLCPRSVGLFSSEAPWEVVAVHSSMIGAPIMNGEVTVYSGYSTWTTNHADWIPGYLQGHLPKIELQDPTLEQHDEVDAMLEEILRQNPGLLFKGFRGFKHP